MGNSGERYGASELSTQIASDAMGIACEAYNVRLDDMIAPNRKSARVSFARQIAMYLSHVVGQLPMGEISLVFKRDRTTVAHACHTIEDRRDSAFFDSQIEFLESEMRERLLKTFSHNARPPIVSARNIRRMRMTLSR